MAVEEKRNIEGEKIVVCMVSMPEPEWDAMRDMLCKEGFLDDSATDKNALVALLEFGLPWESEDLEAVVTRG